MEMASTEHEDPQRIGTGGAAVVLHRNVEGRRGPASIEGRLPAVRVGELLALGVYKATTNSPEEPPVAAITYVVPAWAWNEK